MQRTADRPPEYIMPSLSLPGLDTEAADFQSLMVHFLSEDTSRIKYHDDPTSTRFYVKLLTDRQIDKHCLAEELSIIFRTALHDIRVI